MKRGFMYFFHFMVNIEKQRSQGDVNYVIKVHCPII